jgi:hypothetical protein
MQLEGYNSIGYEDYMENQIFTRMGRTTVDITMASLMVLLIIGITVFTLVTELTKKVFRFEWMRR